VEDFVVRELLVPIFRKGTRVYNPPSLEETRRYCLSQVDTLWEEVTRFENPHAYYVDLSRNLWQVRRDLLEAAGHPVIPMQAWQPAYLHSCQPRAAAQGGTRTGDAGVP
jgi:hypothetical protein